MNGPNYNNPVGFLFLLSHDLILNAHPLLLSLAKGKKKIYCSNPMNTPVFLSSLQKWSLNIGKCIFSSLFFLSYLLVSIHRSQELTNNLYTNLNMITAVLYSMKIENEVSELQICCVTLLSIATIKRMSCMLTVDVLVQVHCPKLCAAIFNM